MAANGQQKNKQQKNKRSVLVTGASGALAQQVIRRLLRKRHNVVAVDFRHEPRIRSTAPSYRLDFHKRDFEDVFREHRLDGIIHLGRIEAGLGDRFHRYNANVLGTRRMLKLALRYGVGQVVLLSTYFVYGAHAYNPALLSEDAPLMASQLSVELADAVELENLGNIYMWKHPELNITILRPSNIAGPGVNNVLSRLLSSRVCPVMSGFSPLMQFIDVEDMANAVVAAVEGNKPDIYNVTLDDWVPFQDAVKRAGCVRLPLPSVPSWLPRRLSRGMSANRLPTYLVDYLKYPVVIDGTRFDRTFHFRPRHMLPEILDYYRAKKNRLSSVNT